MFLFPSVSDRITTFNIKRNGVVSPTVGTICEISCFRFNYPCLLRHLCIERVTGSYKSLAKLSQPNTHDRSRNTGGVRYS